MKNESQDPSRREFIGTAAATSVGILSAGLAPIRAQGRGMPARGGRASSVQPAWLVTHPLRQEDASSAVAFRSAVASLKGKIEGTAGRASFDAVMGQVPAPQGVTFEPATVGGISGWWVKPARAVQGAGGAAVLHAHGGWFNWGTAQAYRTFVGQIAARAGTDFFIPDYRLAPEHPFPAAVQDLQASYRGLTEKGIRRIALTGDSAGGDLALVLLSITAAKASRVATAPVGAVAFSPITDLALTGASYDTRAEADPYFTRSQAAGLVRSYLGDADPKNPLASPLYGDLTGLPPVRVYTGDDEVLLDDSRRYVERAVAAGVDARLDVWTGMPHGFVANLGFNAATQALDASGAFLAERFARAR